MKQSPIFTLTMNPAVDVSSFVARLEPSEKLRCSDVHHHAGGGGINVARVLKRFDAPALAIFPVGGAMGTLLKQLLHAEAVPHETIDIAGDTREDFTVSEIATANQYRFVLPGPLLSHAEVNKCLEAVRRHLRPQTYVVASGSLPPGVAEDFYATLAREVSEASAKLVLDTSGPALGAALEHGAFLIKPSRSELSVLVGRKLDDADACFAAARQIVDSGQVAFVAVSLGKDGAILVGRGCNLRAQAPIIEAQTTVGAGDSFLAALVWGFVHQSTPQEALRLAVAAGSAALLAPGTGLCDLGDVHRLKPQVIVEQIMQTA
jgi:6-phosphofructokinase 2